MEECNEGSGTEDLSDAVGTVGGEGGEEMGVDRKGRGKVNGR